MRNYVQAAGWVIVLAVLISAATACGPNTFITVKLQAGANTPTDITQVNINVQLPDTSYTAIVNGVSGKPIVFPSSTTIGVTQDQGDAAQVTAVGRNAATTEIAMGNGVGTTVSDMTVTIEVPLTPFP